MAADVELLPGVLATAEGCVAVPGEGVVAAADLHLGREAALQEGGAGLPAITADPMLERVRAARARHDAHTVVLNGDVKHAFGAASPGTRDEVRGFLAALAAEARVVVVRGNHDAHLESMAPGGVEVVDAFAAGPVAFAHGHLPDAPDAAALVLGHEHPALTLRDAVGATVRLPAFLAHPGRGVVVMPALSPWARGVDVVRLRAFLSPVLARQRPGDFRAVAVGEGELLDFRRVADVRRALRATTE